MSNDDRVAESQQAKRDFLLRKTRVDLGRALVDFLCVRLGAAGYGEVVGLATSVLESVASTPIPDGMQLPEPVAKAISTAAKGVEAMREATEGRVALVKSLVGIHR